MTWANMIKRCENPNDRAYRLYGARGVSVCHRWRESFEAFLEDMGPKPPGMSIDRIDNNGDYEPSNCRWATPLQQANNTRANVFVEFEGRRLTLAQAARAAGLPYNTFYYRERASRCRA